MRRSTTKPSSGSVSLHEKPLTSLGALRTASQEIEIPTRHLVSQVLELMELAWHDCYEEITPPEEVIDDLLLCSGGTLGGLIHAAHLAVIDSRDLAVWASEIRGRTGR